MQNDSPEGSQGVIVFTITGKDTEEGYDITARCKERGEEVPLEAIIEALNGLVEQIEQERSYVPTIH